LSPAAGRAAQAHADGPDQAVARLPLQRVANGTLTEVVIRDGSFELRV
jgi:hypothetical protein